MSYFFENNGTCPIIIGKRNLKKCRKLYNYKSSILGVYNLLHHRKHSNKKFFLKPTLILKKSIQDNYKVNKLCIKKKSKHYLQKEIAGLIKKNHLLTVKLEKTTLDLDMLTELQRKYQKLVQNYYKMETAYNKTNVLLIHQEDKFRQLHMHHEKSILIARKFEQKQNNIITSIEQLKDNNVYLNEDVNLLKSVIYCLNIEIEKYQNKLRTTDKIIKNQTVIDNLDEKEVSVENKNGLTTWGKVNVHALGPLLDAYQENINEKDKLIQRYKKELDISTGIIKEIMSENTNLYIQIEKFKKKYDSYVNKMKFIEKYVNIIKEQNDLLIKQSTIQKQKIQDIYIAYANKIKSMFEINSKVNKECSTCKMELSNLKEFKRLFEDLKHEYECEQKKLNNRIKYLEDVHLENEKQQFTLIIERDQLKIKGRYLEENLKQIQQKVQYLKSTKHTIEISHDSYKKQLNNTTSYCEKLIKDQEKLIKEKQILEHLLEERKKENEDIKYLKSSISHRIETLKYQLKIVQKETNEQLALVEKHVKNQELHVKQIKGKCKNKLQQFQKLLQRKEAVILKLQKEKFTIQDHLEVIWKAANISDKKKKNIIIK